MKPHKIIRQGLVAIATAALLATGASGAVAFCFSNDSLSTKNIHVQQLDRSKFLKSMSSTMDKIANGVCKAASFKNLQRGDDLSNCKEIAKAFKGAREGLKRAGQDLRNDKYMGKPVRAMEQAAEDAFYFVYGMPVVGDTMGYTAYAARETTAAVEKVGKAAGKEIAKAAKKFAKAMTDTIDKITSKRFKKTIKPDGTQCCNHKNRDCNPSGRKDGEIYFRIKYAGVSRVVKIGATDHMECRVNNRHPKRTVCKNYVWPEGPYRAHKHTNWGVMIKSRHTGKCLDVLGNKKGNGANVGMWKCHGGKNQRWVVYKNGTIRSMMNWKCLDVAAPARKAAKNGTNIIMYNCHGASNQRWTYGRDGKIISRAPGPHNWCMEVGGWNKKNGANVNIWKCGGKQANQAWHATKK